MAATAKQQADSYSLHEDDAMTLFLNLVNEKTLLILVCLFDLGFGLSGNFLHTYILVKEVTIIAVFGLLFLNPIHNGVRARKD